MADITKRVAKRAGSLLEPGEQVLAALLVEPKGTYGIAGAAVAMMPRTATAVLASNAGGAHAAEGGLAAQFPGRSSVVAATDRRVVVIPSSGISMDAIATSYRLADISVASNDSRGLGRRLVLAFVDGSSVTVDAQRGQPFNAFTATLTRR